MARGPRIKAIRAVAKLVQVRECPLHRLVMIKKNIRDLSAEQCAEMATTGTGTVELFHGSIQQQETVDRPLHQHPRILLNQFRFPIVTGCEVEVMGRGQFLNDSTHHPSKVALAQVGRQHANAHGAALPQRPGKIIGPVIQPLRRLNDAVARLLRDGLGARANYSGQGRPWSATGPDVRPTCAGSHGRVQASSFPLSCWSCTTLHLRADRRVAGQYIDFLITMWRCSSAELLVVARFAAFLPRCGVLGAWGLVAAGQIFHPYALDFASL